MRGREGVGLWASWEASRAMDGLKRRRPDSNLAMDGEVRLSPQAHPLAAPLEATKVLICRFHSLKRVAMRDRDLLGEISGRLTGLLQSGGAAASDLRGKIEEQLRDGVAELSAIDREEFDAQVRALERAEERIQALEETVAELERRLAGEDAPSAE